MAWLGCALRKSASLKSQVNGAQVARLVGQERQFTARVGGFDRAGTGYRVRTVDGVQEEQPRVAASPGGFADFVKKSAAARLRITCPSAGCRRASSPPDSTTAMNSSVAPTEILKFRKLTTRSVPKMDSMLSSIGSTKQAESWPRGVPALITVGEFGRKSREVSMPWKRSSQHRASAAVPWSRSASAMARATRSNSCSGVSMI